jgi:hypothetical protein
MITKKKFLLAVLACVLFSAAASAQGSYKVSYDSLGNKVLVGKISEKVLANDSAFMWFFTGVNRYRPDSAWIKYISFYRDSFDVVAFVGTWCPDSKRMLPEFYRVMMASSYPMNHIQLYGLDRHLKGEGGAEETYHVDKVPSFILLHDGKEIGRITDHVNRSMEADMVSILQRYFMPAQVSATGTTR